MQSFQIMVINLNDSVERLESFRRQIEPENVNWSRLSAVDGRYGMPNGNFIYDEDQAVIRHDRPLRNGEIGCYLSHIKALENFISSQEKYAIIFEDDVKIPSGSIAKIKSISTKLDELYGDHWDCLNFGASQRKGFQSFAFDCLDMKILRSTYLPVSLPGVLWSRAGAKALLNDKISKIIRGPIDTEMRSFFARRGRSFVPEMPITSRFDFKSDIGLSAPVAIKRSRKGSSLRSKLVRHMPDMINAHFYLNYRRLIK